MPKVGPRPPLVRHLRSHSLTAYRRYADDEEMRLLQLQPGVVVTIEMPIVMPCWLIRLEELTVSQNVLMRTYGNKHKYTAYVGRLTKMFWAAMVSGPIPKATTRRRLTITRYVRSERYRLDRGNFVGGCKPLLDAAVKAGLIRDDRENDLDDHYAQGYERDDERTEILVEDLPPFP
jgi:hypothetical protein